QPALWAVMVSLARLWESWGVRPAAVVGHSQGEIAAACVAGGLSLADGARIAAVRSHLIAAELSGHGAMASVALGRDACAELLEPWTGRLSVAAVNGPRSVLVSGDPEAVDACLAACATRGIWADRVAVDYASHSAQVDTLREALLAELREV